MRMRVQRWSRLSSALVLLAAASLAVPAQEEPPEPTVPDAPAPPEPSTTETAPAPTTLDDDRLGHWQLDLEQWIAQPSGLDYVPVVVASPSDPTGSVQLGTQHGTEGSVRVSLGYDFRGDIGGFSLKYWSHSDQSEFNEFSPGNFSLGEQLVPIRFGGVFDTAAADAMDAFAETKTRDLRLDYTRRAFASEHVSARWSIGLREVDHNRSLGATYHALVANLPFVVGRADLDPLPDTAGIVSQFSGRGPDFGFDFDIPIGKRFRVAAGFSAAVLRGDIATRYSSLTRLYAVRPGGTEIQQILGQDLVEYLEEWVLLPETGPDARPEITQLTVPVGIVNSSRSASAQVIEGSLAARYRVWRQLELFAGFRSTRYADVGVDIRPTLSEFSLIGTAPNTAPGVVGFAVTVPVAGVIETPRSVDYEGFFLGLGYTY